MRDAALFASAAGAHFISAIALLIYTFGAGMARFDSGAAAGVAETLARGLLAMLSLPVLPVLDVVPARWFPGFWGYIPFAANSSVWGMAVVLARRRWRARR